MDLLSNIIFGFGVALSLDNLLFCLAGALLGTLVGVLPGVGPTATIALLLPVTFALEPATSLIMLAGIYYGAQYGGSTTAILINLPGESSSAVTAIDGYQMARQGRAGAALAIAAIGSFIAGTIATLVVAGFAIPLTKVALKFGAAEYFSLMMLGLIASVALAHGSVLKALAMVVLGLMAGLAGVDIYSGTPRFTFGQFELNDGFNFVAVAVGIFGISEILKNLGEAGSRDVLKAPLSGLMPTRADLARARGPMLRGSLLGTVLGILPGGGATLASFASYTVEKRISRQPERFGKGAIEGVAAPEAANNAAAQTSFIPMLTLGIPSNPVMALMVGALVIQGVIPGPKMIDQQPALFWGIIASMWIGNLMLLILNLPLVGLWAQLLRLPYSLLFPAILIFSAIGVYSINANVFDLHVMAAFGLLGFILSRLDCEPAPLLLGFVLGPMVEENFRRAMLISRGDAMTFLERPISAGFLLAALALLILLLLPAISRHRAEVFTEDNG